MHIRNSGSHKPGKGQHSEGNPKPYVAAVARHFGIALHTVEDYRNLRTSGRLIGAKGSGAGRAVNIRPGGTLVGALLPLIA